ncbi:hypothetical protein TWF696_005739 [Orbilia brochopaga]|uniref:Coiled-coil domain-containing protein 16 n=1 Tax=Orbilia brochopaga TaxID=3140254 RepID=A0AAV9UU13_9PEZI
MSTADPRKLLAAARKSRRITSPYASYSLAGALFCNICSNTPIKSESLWDAHVASAQHKTNVARKGGITSTGAATAGKSNKRPAETPSGHDRDDANTKRLKTARADVKNLALPVGFFDDDDDEDEEGAVSTGEVIEPDDKEEEKKEVEISAPAAGPAGSKLPADFFASTTTSTPNSNKMDADADKLDDEWAAFQADIAEAEEEATRTEPDPAIPPANLQSSHTISAPAVSAAEIQQQQQRAAETDITRNSRTIAEEEMEDARAAMADFFDEQSSLEERVQKLKERREMLRRNPGGIDGRVNPEGLHRSNSLRSVQMGGMDDSASSVSGTIGGGSNTIDDEDDDEDYENDEDMFFRRR